MNGTDPHDPGEKAMIYTKMTNKALKLCFRAHRDQVDKSGIPYVFHPFHLAEQMSDEISVCAALLHDVVEDTDITFDDLAREFPAEVVDVLRLLTHDPSVDYFDYVRAIRGNPIAVQIKLADLAHNSDETRLDGAEGISEVNLAYRREKYRKAKAILLGDLP